MTAGFNTDQKPLLLWLGNHFFHKAMIPLGWDVLWHNPVGPAPLDWEGILAITGGRVPEVLLAADKSGPPLVVGQESYPCLTVFYAVDTHIHQWYPFYGQSFDVCLVSLKDHLPFFFKANGTDRKSLRLEPSEIWWSPPYAPDAQPACDDEGAKDWPLLFVGTCDPDKTPERFSFMRALKELLPQLHITRGRFAELYPRAKVVLNHSSAGDLNFRVFEALGSGSCLLTPIVGNGLTELFTPNEDLFLYKEGDPLSAAEKFNHLMNTPKLRRKAALSGLAKVNAGHRATHRAKELDRRLRELFNTGRADDLVKNRLAHAPFILDAYLKLLYLAYADSVDDEELKKALVKAATAPG